MRPITRNGWFSTREWRIIIGFTMMQYYWVYHDAIHLTRAVAGVFFDGICFPMSKLASVQYMHYTHILLILLYILTSHNSWYYKLHTHSLLTYLFYCPSSGTFPPLDGGTSSAEAGKQQDAGCQVHVVMQMLEVYNEKPGAPRSPHNADLP